jgi:hypothetical protein
MHQSPQKPLARRRDKYSDFDLADSEADRRPYRESQPRARKFPLREESTRELRWDKQYFGK